MEKAELQEQNSFLYVIYFRNKQNMHLALIVEFDHPDINVVTFVPIIQSKTPQLFRNEEVFVEVTFNR